MRCHDKYRNYEISNAQNIVGAEYKNSKHRIAKCRLPVPISNKCNIEWKQADYEQYQTTKYRKQTIKVTKRLNEDIKKKTNRQSIARSNGSDKVLAASHGRCKKKIVGKIDVIFDT